MDEGKDALVILSPDDAKPKDKLVTSEKLSPERQLIREIREKALAGKTRIEEIAAFDQSTSGILLGVLEDALQFKELSELVPYFKGRVAGDFHGAMYSEDGRGFNLNFPGYRVTVNEEGTIEIKPPMKGMDDFLLYATEDPNDRARSGAVVKPNKGSVELFSGEPVSPSSETRIRAMFEVTREYFADVRRATPDVANAARMGLSPDMSLPRFPTSKINQVRSVPPSLQ